jgi:hypothetical protein
MVKLYDKKHCSLRVQLRYWALDSWDGGEAGVVTVDGVTIFNQGRSEYSTCTSPWSAYGGSFPNPWAGERSQDQCYMDIDSTVAHTSNTVTLSFSSNIGQGIEDESWAVSGLVLTTNPC